MAIGHPWVRQERGDNDQVMMMAIMMMILMAIFDDDPDLLCECQQRKHSKLLKRWQEDARRSIASGSWSWTPTTMRRYWTRPPTWGEPCFSGEIKCSVSNVYLLCEEADVSFSHCHWIEFSSWIFSDLSRLNSSSCCRLQITVHCFSVLINIALLRRKPYMIYSTYM